MSLEIVTYSSTFHAIGGALLPPQLLNSPAPLDCEDPNNFILLLKLR